MSEYSENQDGQEAAMQEEPSSAERCLISESGGLPPFLSIKYVIEIINGHSITHPPLVPPFVKRIINLRGQILSIVSIYACMDKPEAEYTNKTYVMALNMDNVPLGIVVDPVRQVTDTNLDYVHLILLKHQQKLLDSMTTAEDGSVLMSFDCASLASCRYQ